MWCCTEVLLGGVLINNLVVLGVFWILLVGGVGGWGGMITSCYVDVMSWCYQLG